MVVDLGLGGWQEQVMTTGLCNKDLVSFGLGVKTMVVLSFYCLGYRSCANCYSLTCRKLSEHLTQLSNSFI